MKALTIIVLLFLSSNSFCVKVINSTQSNGNSNLPETIHFDTPPEFPGGIEAMNKIFENIAKNHGEYSTPWDYSLWRNGNATIRLRIDSTGALSHILTPVKYQAVNLNEISYFRIARTEEIIAGFMPKWIPATKSGKTVSSEIELDLSYTHSLFRNRLANFFYKVDEIRSYPSIDLTDEAKEANFVLIPIHENSKIIYLPETPASYPEGYEVLRANFISNYKGNLINYNTYVGFVVKEDGSLSNFFIPNPPNDLEEDYIKGISEALKNSGKWKPARSNGKIVPSYHFIHLGYDFPNKMIRWVKTYPSYWIYAPELGKAYIITNVKEYDNFDQADIYYVPEFRTTYPHGFDVLSNNFIENFDLNFDENRGGGTFSIGFVVNTDGFLSCFFSTQWKMYGIKNNRKKQIDRNLFDKITNSLKNSGNWQSAKVNGIPVASFYFLKVKVIYWNGMVYLNLLDLSTGDGYHDFYSEDPLFHSLVYQDTFMAGEGLMAGKPDYPPVYFGDRSIFQQKDEFRGRNKNSHEIQITFWIDENGRATDIIPDERYSFHFNDQAISILKNVAFHPARKEGIPVRTKYQFTYDAHPHHIFLPDTVMENIRREAVIGYLALQEFYKNNDFPCRSLQRRFVPLEEIIPYTTEIDSVTRSWAESRYRQIFHARVKLVDTFFVWNYFEHNYPQYQRARVFLNRGIFDEYSVFLIFEPHYQIHGVVAVNNYDYNDIRIIGGPFMNLEVMLDKLSPTGLHSRQGFQKPKRGDIDDDQFTRGIEVYAKIISIAIDPFFQKPQVYYTYEANNASSQHQGRADRGYFRRGEYEVNVNSFGTIYLPRIFCSSYTGENPGSFIIRVNPKNQKVRMRFGNMRDFSEFPPPCLNFK